MGLEDDGNLNGIARIFKIRNYFVVTLIAVGVLAAYFRLWQILIAMTLLGVGAVVWVRGRSPRDDLPPS